MVRHLICNQVHTGSIPVGGSQRNIYKGANEVGSLRDAMLSARLVDENKVKAADQELSRKLNELTAANLKDIEKSLEVKKKHGQVEAD